MGGVSTTPDAPQYIDVDRDLDALSFTLTDWSAALWRAFAGVTAFFGMGVVGAIASSGIDAVLPQLQIVAALVPIGTLVLTNVLGRHFRLEVRIDAFGASITGRHRRQRVRWSDFDRVERKGRRLFVHGPAGRVELPTPTAYTDAAWMERVVREGVEAIAVEDGAVPATLVGLRGRGTERA